jgi:hypothetical protein
MTGRRLVLTIFAIIAIVLGVTAAWGATVTGTASCTPSPSVSQGPDAATFAVTCTVPNAVTATETTTATATATATVTLTPTGSPTSPAPATVGWGFNLFNGWNGYTQTTSETSTQVCARLKAQGFGSWKYEKVFYGGFLPATWAKGTQGEADPTCPADTFLTMFTWTPGTIADGSHDAALTAYLRSVPAGKRVLLGRNEIDNKGLTATQWPLYVADMDHLYDLKTSLGVTGVEVWDCFMGWSLDPASGPAWRDSWTNPAKRDGVIFDYYWNKSTVDKAGTTAVGFITAKVRQLGLPWILGETGDRRPGTANSTETDDSTRAASLTNRLNAVLAGNPVPDAVLWFDVVGTTGDHRLLDVDTATRAALAGFMQR